jgi:fructuronate reductase
MMRLSRATLPALPQEVRRPAHDPATLGTGIVHLGIGAFQRAHQAAFTQPLLAADPRWGTLGASLRHSATRDALAPQDRLYTLAERDGSGERLTVMATLTGIVSAPAEAGQLLAHLAAADTRIVSLTITEKGYGRGADGGLDAGDPAIRRDLARDALPRTAPGLLVAALHARREAGIPPFAVLSCDNLPANGRTTARILADYARLAFPGLGDWITQEVSCPDTMVDRIVPATTEADRLRVAAALGAEDAWPVLAEPFRQWVIEDRFPLGRPAWEQTGATLVADVRPWEEMKLRLLNGAHSAIAYLGQLAGWETVADAMADPALFRFVGGLMAEASTTLHLPPGTDLPGYRDSLLARFCNPALRHRTAQIAADGSQKMPQRLFATGAERLQAGHGVAHVALAIAAWLRAAGGQDDGGRPIAFDDPIAARLAELGRPQQDAGTIARRFFAEPGLVPEGARRPDFESAVAASLATLCAQGAQGALARME